MSEKEKTSDAVRITRIVSPTVLIIALALIFKPEISKVLSGGCFELNIAQAGLGMSDKSLCTKEDFEETKDTLLMAGARQAEEAANVFFQEYENRIAELDNKNAELAEKLFAVQKEIERANKKQAEYSRVLQSVIRRTSSTEARTVAAGLAEQFSAIYGEDIPLIRLDPVEVADPKVAAEKNAAIRQDYIKTSRSNVTRVQENVTVEKRR